MRKYTSVPVQTSEITPEHIYLNRRQFMKLGAAAGMGAVLAACAPQGAASPAGDEEQATTAPAPVTGDTAPAAGVNDVKKDELGDPLNTYEQITNYNNFYEFTRKRKV